MSLPTGSELQERLLAIEDLHYPITLAGKRFADEPNPGESYTYDTCAECDLVFPCLTVKLARNE